MSDDELTVVFGGHRREITCTQLREGDNGLYLIDKETNTQKGYVPYEKLDFVKPKGENVKKE